MPKRDADVVHGVFPGDLRVAVKTYALRILIVQSEYCGSQTGGSTSIQVASFQLLGSYGLDASRANPFEYAGAGSSPCSPGCRCDCSIRWIPRGPQQSVVRAPSLCPSPPAWWCRTARTHCWD